MEDGKKRVVVINGGGGVGKDAFCRACSRYADCMVRSSIDPIKAFAGMVGWTGGKTERDRKYLSDLKALASAYNDFPMVWMRGAVATFNEKWCEDELLFIHIREPEEVERAAAEFGAVKLLVTNRRVAPITSNASDSRVMDCRYDYVVANDGSLAELDEKAAEFVRRIRCGEI